MSRGKTIRELIQELQSFEDQDREVRMSLDYSDTHHPISMLAKSGGYCVLVNAEAYYAGPWQKFMDEQVSKRMTRARASKKKKAEP